ncbi:MAG: glycosyltransferase [Bacteroidales bacterium]|nr:MAG: glycosyltransferase [Bacteroidales bacterium]
MKILLVLDQEFPSDIRVENEAEALIEAGHEVHLACFTKKGRTSNEVYHGINIHRRNISTFTYKSSIAALKFPFYFNYWRSFLSDLVKEFQFNAIHINDLPLAQVGYEVKIKFGCKLIIDLHENWPAFLEMSTHTKTVLGRLLSSNKQWISYEKRILHFADVVIVVVDEAKTRLINLGVEESKIVVVCNTLNTNHFDLAEGQPDPNLKTIYYAGGISFHRGLQTVIEALPTISEQYSNIRFWILGSGKYQVELKALANRLGVEDKITFFGHRPLSDVAKYLAMADYAVIPHLKSDHTDSTIPHKLFQYMFAEKPIISSNCSPIERILDETNTGISFQSNSSKSFAERFLSLISGQSHVSAGKNWVLEKYNWNTDKKRLSDAYQNLTKK